MTGQLQTDGRMDGQTDSGCSHFSIAVQGNFIFQKC